MWESDRCFLSDKVRLSEYICITPFTDSDRDAWLTYLQYNLPVLRHRIESFRPLEIRKAKFATRKRTDSFLDKICLDIIDLGASQADMANLRHSGRKGPKGIDVAIAFGAANTSSGGFGYSSIATSRLKHRLEHVHGCKVCLIDEYMTSQKCSRCEEKLVYVGVKTLEAQLKAEAHCKASGRKPPLYGVLKCLRCRTFGSMTNLHWHRDINAAINIAKVFTNLAKGLGRPAYLCPKDAKADADHSVCISG
jgi:hypothetical protein